MNSSHALRNKLTGPVIIGTNDFASRNNANDVALSPVSDPYRFSTQLVF